MKKLIFYLSVLFLLAGCSKDCHLDHTDIDPVMPEGLDLEYYGLAIKNGNENWVGHHSDAFYVPVNKVLGIKIYHYLGNPRDSLLWEELSFTIPEKFIDINREYTVLTNSVENEENGDVITGNYVPWEIDAFRGSYGISPDCDKGRLILDEVNEEYITGSFQVSFRRDDLDKPSDNPDHINFTKGSFKARVDTIR